MGSPSMGGLPLLKERCYHLFNERGVFTWELKWLQPPCLYKRGERLTKETPKSFHTSSSLTCIAWRSPARGKLFTKSITTPLCCWNRSHLFLPLACWIKKKETSSSCTCASLRRYCSFAVLIGSNFTNNFTKLR